MKSLQILLEKHAPLSGILYFVSPILALILLGVFHRNGLGFLWEVPLIAWILPVVYFGWWSRHRYVTNFFVIPLLLLILAGTVANLGEKEYHDRILRDRIYQGVEPQKIDREVAY